MPEINSHTPRESIYGNLKKKNRIRNTFLGTKEEGSEKSVMVRSVHFGRGKTNPRILKGTKGSKLGNQQLT